MAAVAAAMALVAVLATPLPLRARAAVTTLLVADVSPLSNDDQLLFAALEGIVNRSSARIYLLGMRNGQDFATDPTDRLWLHDAVPMATASVTPGDLLDRFAKSGSKGPVKGLVVWDPALPVDTQNIATTIAGLYDYLPVSPGQLTSLTGAPYTQPVKVDLRGRFTSRAQAYDWALATYPPPKSSYGLMAWLGGPRNGNPGQHGLRDFVVAHRGFAFEADPQSEGPLASSILDAFPAETPVFGYPFFDDPIYEGSRHAVAPGEGFGVGEVSRSGKFLVPSTDSTNLTVHSSFSPMPQTTPWDDSAATPDPTKTYVALLISDGDNLGYNQQALRTLHWDDPDRVTSTVPVGISVSPWLALYAPRIYDFYVHGLRANEVLVSGPSGAGYIYPQFHSDLATYLANTKARLAFAGLHSQWILDDGYVSSPSPVITKQYAAALSPTVSALFSDYGGYVVTNPPPVSFSNGVPVVHALWGDSVANTVGRVRASATTYPGRPAFVLVALSTWGMSYLQAQQVMDQLGTSFVAVRPDRFVGLIKGAYGALAGGAAS